MNLNPMPSDFGWVAYAEVSIPIRDLMNLNPSFAIASDICHIGFNPY